MIDRINKKASIGENLMNNIVYLLLALVFLVAMVYFVSAQRNNSAFWEEYYAKEIAKMIDLSKPGDVISLDISTATGVAKKGLSDSQLFVFNNVDKEICVQFSFGRKSCYGYFNNVDVNNVKVERGVPGNVLSFNISRSKE